MPYEFDRNLLELLPPHYREIGEFQEICSVEEEQLALLAQLARQVADNFHVQTMDEEGVSTWESALGILPHPAQESLDFRRARVLNRVATRPPFTLGVLYQRLDALLGAGQWQVTPHYDTYHLSMETPLQKAEFEGELRALMGEMLGAHIAWQLRYQARQEAEQQVGILTWYGQRHITLGVGEERI